MKRQHFKNRSKVRVVEKQGYDPSSQTFFRSHSAATQHGNLHTFLKKQGSCCRPQVSKQMPRVDLKSGGRCCLCIVKPDMPFHCHAWVYITCWEIPPKNCQWKEISTYPITDLYFNQEPIKLQHGPLEILNPFFLILFQHCVLKSADMLPSFLLF